eukprot:gene6644-7156_t
MFIKANLEERLLQDIERITKYLSYEVFPDGFRSQTELSPSERFHYHLTVVGPIDKHFGSSRDIDQFTDQWDASSNLIEIFPTTTIRVTANGRVIWLVNTMNLKEVGLEMFHALSNRHTAASLPRVNNYVGSDTLHITLGEVTQEDDMNRNIALDDHMFMSLLHSYHISGFGWNE